MEYLNALYLVLEAPTDQLPPTWAWVIMSAMAIAIIALWRKNEKKDQQILDIAVQSVTAINNNTAVMGKLLEDKKE